MSYLLGLDLTWEKVYLRSEDMDIILNDVTAYYNENGRILEKPLQIYQKVNGKSVLFPPSLWWHTAPEARHTSDGEKFFWVNKQDNIWSGF